MADNCSTASSTSSAPSRLNSQSGRGKAQVASRKQKQELRRERVRKAASLKTDDVTNKNSCTEAVNVIKDTLKVKYETGTDKVTKLKDQELNKLRQDLARCQLELREEVEKRGQSTSARSGFDQERRRLVGELREAGEAKRRLEAALEAASTNVRRKTAEMREMQESEKLKLTALEKSANNEIRKLLDDLKNKDQQIAALQSTDRHGHAKNDKLYQAKGFSKKNHHHHHSPQLAHESLESNFDNTGSNIFPSLSGNITAQRRMYLLENQLQRSTAANEYLNKCNKDYEEEKLNLEKSVEKLQNQNRQLKSDLGTLKIEAAKLTELLSEKNILLIKDQIETLKETNHGQKLIIESMHLDGRSILNKAKPERKKHRKTLSFLLPGDTAPTPGGKFPMFIDESTMTGSDLFYNGSMNLNIFNDTEVATNAIDEEEPEKMADHAPTKDPLNENKIINDDVTGDVNEFDDPVTESPIKEDGLDAKEEEHYDEELAEEHLQMEASFELMMQQEMMHQEQIHHELMQQELLQQMQTEWEEEKENMCYELIELKEKLKKKTESEYLSVKLSAELKEKYEILEFKYLELEGDKNQIEQSDFEAQTESIATTDSAVQPEESDFNNHDLQHATYPDVISLASEDDIFKMTSSSVSSNTSGFVEAAMRVADGNGDAAGPWMDLCEDLETKLRESRRKLRQVGDRAALIVAEKERRIRHLEDILQEDCSGENEIEKGILIDTKRSTLFDWTESCRSPSVEVEAIGFQRFWSLSDDEEEQNERKIATLEKDCQALREIVEVDESIIEGLQRQVESARLSEASLKQLIERLESSDAEISEKMACTEEENLTLRREIDGLEKIEKMQRCTIAELRSCELSVNDRISDMTAEFNSVEAGLKRRLSEAQREVENITKLNVNLEDREGELAVVIDHLRKKINNLQLLNHDLQQQINDRPVSSSKLAQAYAQCIDEERTKNELLAEGVRRWQEELALARRELADARDQLSAATFTNCKLSMQLEESVFVEARLASQILELKTNATSDSGSKSHTGVVNSTHSENTEESNSLSEVSELPEDEEGSNDVTRHIPKDDTERGDTTNVIRSAGSLESLNDSGFSSAGRKTNAERFLKPSKIPRNIQILLRRTIAPSNDTDYDVIKSKSIQN